MLRQCSDSLALGGAKCSAPLPPRLSGTAFASPDSSVNARTRHGPAKSVSFSTQQNIVHPFVEQRGGEVTPPVRCPVPSSPPYFEQFIAMYTGRLCTQMLYQAGGC